jgi:hypothetical protein
MMLPVFGFFFCVPFAALPLDHIGCVVIHGHRNPLANLSEDYELGERSARHRTFVQRLDVSEALTPTGLRDTRRRRH